MNTLFSHGWCPRCKQLNLWHKLTCDFCGERLPWADLATCDQHGARCPHCDRENLFCATACEGCGKRLPWADTLEMVRGLAVNAREEERKTAITISLCIIGSIVFMTLMMVEVLIRTGR
jgi:hypothetical protein